MDWEKERGSLAFLMGVETSFSSKISPIEISIKEGLKTISSRLLFNPDVVLDEYDEINRYLSQHSQEYLAKLLALDHQVDRPMKPECRLSICIPAYREAVNIYRTLTGFAGQQRINPNQFEINILNNYRKGEVADKTQQEIERFRHDYPEIQINYAYAIFPKELPFGAIRKTVFDLAIWRIKQRGCQIAEHILLSADADSYGYSRNSLYSVIHGFDQDPKTDILVGSFVYPQEALEKYPILAAAFHFHRLYRIIKTRQDQRLPWTSGRATAFTAKIYAAVGGLDARINRASDIEFGVRVQKSRGEYARQYIRRACFKVATDPRRVLLKMVQPDKSYTDEFEDIDWTNNVEVTGKSWQEYSFSTLETLTVEQLEKEFSAILVKKAWREGRIKRRSNLTELEKIELQSWLEENFDLIERILRLLKINNFKIDSQREVVINGIRIPRILIIENI